ncbi:MAG: hypothetical protein CME88_17710 [Hirschia sp.]|nr:hypothetical protein [Hirschia sp.]MBF19074.1 hypothetical protein [Hirschia sp.]MBF20208.1 hypothetical protein [Hirschia sp.]
MKDEDIRKILGQTPFFQNLSDDMLTTLASAGRTRNIKKGQSLFSVGDSGDAVYAVLEGRILLSRVTSEGKEIALAGMERGDLFGELSLIDGDARSADATAAENTNLFVLERQAFWSILREQSDIAEALLIMMCQRLRATNELVESVSFLELGPRLARLLLILAARADVDEEGVVTLQSRYTQGELAKRIAASRESVSKQISQWTRDGLLDIENGRVKILDPETISLIADTGDEDW